MSRGMRVGLGADMFISLRRGAMPRKPRMKHRKDQITNAMPDDWHNVGHNEGVARNYPANWTESSMDLMAGLEVVELSAEREWAATMPFELEPLERRTSASN
jgi:hypothetical protein